MCSARIRSRGLDALAFGATALLAAIFYTVVLTRDPLIYGVDGPYYLTQVRSLLRTGALAYGDPPLAFYVFAGLSLLIGDITMGVKAGVSVLCALAAVPAYLLSKRATGSVLASSTAALVLVFSAGLLRMAADLMKNAVGVVFVVWAIYFAHRALEEGATRLNTAGAIAALLLSALTHVLDLGVALLYLISYTLLSVVLRVNGRGMLKFLLAVVAALAGFALVATLLYGRLFTDFGKGLVFLQELFSTLSAGPGTGPSPPPVPPLAAYSAYVFAALGAILSYKDYRRGRRTTAIFTASNALALVFLVFPATPSKWLWRFILMAFIPISQIAGRVVAHPTGVDSRALVAGLILLLTTQETILLIPTLHPTITPSEYRDLVDMTRYVPNGSAVAAQMPLGYWAEYVLDGKLVRTPPRGGVAELYVVAPNGTPVPPWQAHLLYRGRQLSLFRTPASR